MLSTFSGIEIGKRSMIAHTEGLNTIGHNLSNASTEGYSRQRVQLEAFEPIYFPQLNREETPGQLGQGVVVKSVDRLRDLLLDQNIVRQQSQEGYWESRDNYALQLEQIYNEPTESSTRSHLDRFWDAWQELSVHPEEMAARENLVSRGQTFLDSVHDRFQRLTALRETVDQDIQAQVKQVNDITREIAGLNELITKSRALGDNPNDVLDRRDLLVDKLSKLIDITTDNRDKDEFMIHTGGKILVQGGIASQFSLSTDTENDGLTRVDWQWNGEQADFRSGSLKSLLTMRDGDIRDEIQSLDVLSLSFSDMVNEIHRSGYGLNGKTGTDFFVERPYINNLAGNYDGNGDGQYDSSYIYRITGANKLQAKEQIGLAGSITLPGKDADVQVSYNPVDTVEDVVNRINRSGAEVTARLDREGKLELKATPAASKDRPNFVIRSLSDSGEFLVGYSGVLKQSGEAGAYTWQKADAVLSLKPEGVDYAVSPIAHPSGWLEINPELKSDLTSIAAGLGQNGKPSNQGDGSAALAIASLRNNNVMVGSLTTFDDYFQDAVVRAGARGQEAERVHADQALVMKDLKDKRESISGVNMDEEMSEMIKFQHGYAAAAKFISTVNEMLDTIINRMGV
jgi:flagellar hook-associated protein 1 FlgK